MLSKEELYQIAAAALGVEVEDLIEDKKEAKTESNGV